MKYTVYAPQGVIMEFPNKKEALTFARLNRGFIMSSIANFGRVV